MAKSADRETALVGKYEHRLQSNRSTESRLFTRRSFLKLTGLAGAGLMMPWQIRGSCIPPMTGDLDPLRVPKYVTNLVVPPAMPLTDRFKNKGRLVDYYEIAVRQFRQQILPPGCGSTAVWSYGSANHRDSFNYPAFTIEAKHNVPVRVTWINQLVDSDGRFLPHLLPVDQTLHWANPPGGRKGRDDRGTDQTPYCGPVPIVTHVHGAHTTDESNGYAEAWYLPQARNIPRGYARVGSWYRFFEKKFKARYGQEWCPGSATFQYPNDQPATTMWYHDHTLGITRLNVYAGTAGFYLLRGGPYDAPDPLLPGPGHHRYSKLDERRYEVPLAIQDRSFNADGSLFYPDNRAFFEGLQRSQLQIPFFPDPACNGPSDVPPIWNPEFFGNTMVVNGRTWPVHKVEPRRYRFRLLNGCNTRFLILKLVSGDPTARPGVPELPFWQIGAEGGFLPQPVQLSELLMAPAERADVIVDFTRLPVGTELYLINEGPDEPFGGGVAGTDFPYANPQTTGQVMKFVVRPLRGEDPSTDPASPGFMLPAPPPPGPATYIRQLSLNEQDSATVRVIIDPSGNVLLACNDPAATPFGPVAALLGLVQGAPGSGFAGVPLHWDDPVTENPALGATEVWELFNFTVDAHPIHVHLVQFQVLGRQSFNPVTGALGPERPPDPNETGLKDTVIAYPGEITRIKATFDLPGQYVWHCHILEHEDNEMMRPYSVGPIQRPGRNKEADDNHFEDEAQD